jgi:hypothetical protein
VSDRPDAPSSDESPEIAEVRRLLADARHLEPMPDDVAARMSRVLGRLSDETPAARPESAHRNVIAIAPQRRRRAAALLVAAAAIVVGGVVIQNIHLSSAGDSAATSAAPDSQKQAQGGAEDQSEPPSTPNSASSADAPKTPVKIRPRRFSSDAERARQDLGKSAYRVEQDTAKAVCTDVPRSAQALPATYKRFDATLVFRRPQGGSQVVELFLCGSSSPIRSVTLPVP